MAIALALAPRAPGCVSGASPCGSDPSLLRDTARASTVAVTVGAMLGRLQRRPGPDAPPSAHVRFARDWAWAVAAIVAIFALQGQLTSDDQASLLEILAGGLLRNAAWMTLVTWGVARRERRRPWHVKRPQSADAWPRNLLGDWMLSVVVFPLPAVAFVLIDGIPNGLGEAALAGWMLALVRVLVAKRDAGALCLPERDRVRLGRLVKVAAIVTVMGYAVGLVAAVAGSLTWVPVWPGLALGWACGIASLAQLISFGRARGG
jgi:hypothetical protein